MTPIYVPNYLGDTALAVVNWLLVVCVWIDVEFNANRSMLILSFINVKFALMLNSTPI